VLSIKQAITREVTEGLRLKLSSEDRQRLVKRDSTNSEAYRFYLRGRHFWNKRTADGLKKAVAEFQQAIDRDPNYVLGYVGLADAYGLLDFYGGAPTSETLPKARTAVDRALQIDDSLAEAHASSGWIYQMSWQWAEAEKEYRRAIALNPNYATAHQWFALYLTEKHQFEDALSEIKRVHELDPLSLVIGDNLSIAYLMENDINSAIDQATRLIELNPKFPPGHLDLAFPYLKQRRYEEAILEAQKAVEFSERDGQRLGDLGYCYAVTGRRADALQIVRELEEKYAKQEANEEI
jgi:tetratricopeptide (TPR) repeat protein